MKTTMYRRWLWKRWNEFHSPLRSASWLQYICMPTFLKFDLLTDRIWLRSRRNQRPWRPSMSKMTTFTFMIFPRSGPKQSWLLKEILDLGLWHWHLNRAISDVRLIFFRTLTVVKSNKAGNSTEIIPQPEFWSSRACAVISIINYKYRANMLPCI